MLLPGVAPTGVWGRLAPISHGPRGSLLAGQRARGRGRAPGHVHDADGEPVQGRGQAYRLGDGTLSAFVAGVPRYDRTEFPEVTLFLPYDEFPGGGFQGLSVRAGVWCVRDRRYVNESAPAMSLSR